MAPFKTFSIEGRQEKVTLTPLEDLVVYVYNLLVCTYFPGVLKCMTDKQISNNKLQI